MRQGPPIRFAAVDTYGRSRLRTILDYDSSTVPMFMWVYTAPSYDRVYHMRKKDNHQAICGTVIIHYEPSLVYSAFDIPKFYCGFCQRHGVAQAAMHDFSE